MLQTRARLAHDLPAVLELEPSRPLYRDVDSLATAAQSMPIARVLVPQRKAFCRANQI